MDTPALIGQIYEDPAKLPALAQTGTFALTGFAEYLNQVRRFIDGALKRSPIPQRLH